MSTKVSLPKIDKDGNYSVIEVEKWRLLYSAFQNKGDTISLTGPDSSTLGPHVRFYTSDAYPLLQILPYGHDGISLLFDSYFDGAWKSSDAGSNARLVKTTDGFYIEYDSGVAQGSTITWNAGFVMDLATGKVGIGAAPLTNENDVALLKDGILAMKETTTPTADTNYGKVYTKNDNKIYFQDGAGAEHEIAFV